ESLLSLRTHGDDLTRNEGHPDQMTGVVIGPPRVVVRPQGRLGNVKQRRVEFWHGITGQGSKKLGKSHGRQLIRRRRQGLFAEKAVAARSDSQLRHSRRRVGEPDPPREDLDAFDLIRGNLADHTALPGHDLLLSRGPLPPTSRIPFWSEKPRVRQ